MNTVRSWPGLRAKALTVALTLACAQAAFSASALSPKPDALLQIDLNRVSVVEKIVESWKGELPAAQMGSFRSKLSALRADQLLAANLSGSFDGVLDIVNRHETTQANLTSRNSADVAKALGDNNNDLVYTALTPCRLFDTRPSQGGTGAIASGTSRTFDTARAGGNFASQGGKNNSDCGVPTGVSAVVVILTRQGGAAGRLPLDVTQRLLTG
jgi:hypothetical protein